MILPTETFFHPDRPEEQKEEKQDAKRETEEEKEEEDKKEQKKEKLKHSRGPQMNLLATVFKLRRELHRAEEQRTRVRRRLAQRLGTLTHRVFVLRVWRRRRSWSCAALS